MGLSMLEQIAQRFELYASDQNAMLRRNKPGTNEYKACVVRANTFMSAAKELRKIGADNRDTFLNEIKLSLLMAGDPAEDIVSLFITKPIPAARIPTPTAIHVERLPIPEASEDGGCDCCGG